MRDFIGVRIRVRDAFIVAPYYITGHNSEDMHSEELAQKFGVHAIGEPVCRSFGEDGIFHGVVTAFRREGRTELYTVEYTDGDCEDMDKEEYNFGYALWLKEEGWNAEESEVVVREEKKKKLVQHKESIAEKKLAKLTQAVDLTSKNV